MWKKRHVRYTIFCVAGLLLLAGCLRQSPTVIAVAIITLSTLDLIHGDVWWLGDDWNANPDSIIARYIAIGSLIVGILLLIAGFAL